MKKIFYGFLKSNGQKSRFSTIQFPTQTYLGLDVELDAFFSGTMAATSMIHTAFGSYFQGEF